MGSGGSTVSSMIFPPIVDGLPLCVRIDEPIGCALTDTADADSMDTNVKSPGNSSFMEGGQGIWAPRRTMKEYEEQMNFLQKENFNLKLRIFMLDERLGINSSDQEVMKKALDGKMENESLKKELMEKHELLVQAARAMELVVEQKSSFERQHSEDQEALEQERSRAEKLEKEVEECKAKLNDAAYFEETFGISPEEALECKEKLQQVEEIKASLESELKQLSASLDEEREWAREVEKERDQLRIRLDAEVISKEKLALKRDREMEALNERIKELEEQVLKKEGSCQQLRKDVVEKDKVIGEKNALLEEKSRVYEEVSAVAEKRKKMLDQQRSSIIAMEASFTDLNIKHRNLLAKFDGSRVNSSTLSLADEQLYGKTYGLCSPTRSCGPLDLSSERAKTRDLYGYLDRRDPQEMKKELEEMERELRKQEELKKQLNLKLYYAQESVQESEKNYKKLQVENRKALQMIQSFMKRHEQSMEQEAKKNRRILELEAELSKLRNDYSRASRTSITSTPVRKKLSGEYLESPERDSSAQQRFEELESKINDLRDQIDTVKAEKSLLEKQTKIESEELRERLENKDLKIECLECEKQSIECELRDKANEYDKLKEQYNKDELRRELEDKNRQIEELSKELQIKTHNLQHLVNTELWSKNREIAKLQNYVTATQCGVPDSTDASLQLRALIKELNDIGIQVMLTDDIVQLNYADSETSVDASTLTSYIHKLLAQKAELEEKVDYLKWLNVVSKPSSPIGVAEVGGCDSSVEKDRKYCEMLRTHLKELVKFMNEMLREQSAEVKSKQKKIVYDALMKSNILSEDFINTLDCIKPDELDCTSGLDKSARKSKSDNLMDSKNQLSTPSDSETFSEPDRTVSQARMGLPEIRRKFQVTRARLFKYAKKRSDSEDSGDSAPGLANSCQSDGTDCDANRQILELKDINNFLCSELNSLKKELMKTLGDDFVNNKLSMLLTKLEKSSLYCEKLQNTLEKKIHECHSLKKESKQNSARKLQLEIKILEMEGRALELTKQKGELLQFKETVDKKTADMIFVFNKDNEVMRLKIKQLEDEIAKSNAMVSKLTTDLDQLTMTNSQIVVENTQLTNDKLRLEQDLRKSENHYGVTVRNLQDKFHKEVTDLNQANESHRARLQELEATNKELRRHVIVCEASDSAPSSSGISSIPPDVGAKSIRDDILGEYDAYNGVQNWLPLTYQTSSGRSKSSCSPDLGIESDTAGTSSKPYEKSLKITESMNNLLSDDESGLLYYSLEEVRALKNENAALRRRLMRTKRALEDTFHYLSASNKNKRSVEKAITIQLMITKNILKKTRNYEETQPRDN
ncbi:CDK5 regulatory subunit-associated protein 2 isoform X3 [Copidosoma floridanum]|uniref:CDK5 regulatory subunit-associated protein 2 isoform X3 n=1 Tax=Copidosoma floridanum TaxID=29053 RepID=UPI0006C948D3|nr:CDK5 regulatory subunit-associated protein 2 isoform X3 [Copidosoma floridanum]